MKRFHLHLVSDATGETINSIARAAISQFEDIEVVEHFWSLVRGRQQIEKVLAAIEANPGVVVFTLVDAELREILETGCRRLNVPAVPVLEPVIAALSSYLGIESHGEPGRQHALDGEYFDRIDAMHFVLTHDDGQSLHNLENADVVLLGVSRTSKTPTCFYLANRGIKAGNVPLVPGSPIAPEVEGLDNPVIIGLTTTPERLIQVRRNRLRSMNHDQETDYVDLAMVREEVLAARRLFAKHEWPIIDVTRRSIEEVAAEILQHIAHRHGGEVVSSLRVGGRGDSDDAGND
jgi:regulator of PEP synthase PpsR (kinase-PPPase family)